MVVAHYGDCLAHGTREQMCGYQSVLPSTSSLNISHLSLLGPFASCWEPCGSWWWTQTPLLSLRSDPQEWALKFKSVLAVWYDPSPGPSPTGCLPCPCLWSVPLFQSLSLEEHLRDTRVLRQVLLQGFGQFHPFSGFKTRL